VVQALTAQKQTITIEQPEVHIHPRLQADLGDLLAECIKEPRQNRFIIETHSEHLVLRLQRLVRTGRLKPEDVSILYVMHAKEGSEVRRLRVDDEGDFIDDWPGGFFPERLREFEG
jgi:predicted ATPase